MSACNVVWLLRHEALMLETNMANDKTYSTYFILVHMCTAGPKSSQFQIAYPVFANFAHTAQCGYAGLAQKSDCNKAITQLQDRNDGSCLVPQGQNASIDLHLAFDYGPLAAAGSCQVILGGYPANTLSCLQVATYATALTDVCGTGQMNTGGSVYAYNDYNDSVGVTYTLIAVLSSAPS